MTKAVLVFCAVALLVGDARTARGQACAVGADVSGSEVAVVEAVQEAIARRGVVPVVPAGCPLVHVVVRRDERGLLVEVRDADGRQSERVVSDADGAATVVESWARRDLSMPLLAPRTTALPRTPQAIDSEKPPPLPPAPALHRKEDSGPQVAAAAETAIASDGTVWLGAHASACGEWGPTCTGVLARVAFDTEKTGESARTATGRTGIDFMVGSDLPFAFGKLRASPGLALGGGWLHTTHGVEGGSSSNVQVELERGGVRANAHILLSWSVASHFAVDTALHLDWFVAAHQRDFRDGTTTLAGEPWGLVRASLGLRYGVP